MSDPKDNKFNPQFANPELHAKLSELSERERMLIAIQIVSNAGLKENSHQLHLVIAAAQKNLSEQEDLHLAVPTSSANSIDPTFMRIFLECHNHPDAPSISKAYKQACLRVTQNKLTCAVSSEDAIKQAFSKHQ
jgi:hypothetical protein